METCPVDKSKQKFLSTGEVCHAQPQCGAAAVFFQGECVTSSSNCEAKSGNAFDGLDTCQAYCVSKTAVLDSVSKDNHFQIR